MLNQISIDIDKINKGVWQSLHGSKFLIASIESQAFKQAVLDCKDLTEDQLMQILAKTILLDWLHVKNPSGDDIEYSQSMAVLALTQSDEVRGLVDSVSTTLRFYCEL